MSDKPRECEKIACNIAKCELCGKDYNTYRPEKHVCEVLNYETKIRRLERRIEQLREGYKIIDYANRSRGYPMPSEWQEVVNVAKNIIKADDEASK